MLDRPKHKKTDSVPGDASAPAVATATYSYKAFISYSHAADDRLAPSLQEGLHKFAKPWYQRRALRVFRDDTHLVTNASLWTSIEAALEDAEYFIYLASPRAAASEWVQKEIAFWKENRPSGKLLIILTDGEIYWDSRRGDFDWSKTTALPELLSGVFDEEPLHLDLKWAHAEPHLSLRHPRFRMPSPICHHLCEKSRKMS